MHNGSCLEGLKGSLVCSRFVSSAMMTDVEDREYQAQVEKSRQETMEVGLRDS